jgi:phosphoribosylformimino-5-aminoimidazole carboxamide ribotide isomerase
VDLDGARYGAPTHVEVVKRILAAVPDARVQVGGGIRDQATAMGWLSVGVHRVVLGTLAVADPALAALLCEQNPGRVVISIDARADQVAIEGWTRASPVSALELARRVDAWGAAAILFTSIERDGAGKGPDVESTVRLQREVRTDVIASGGVRTLGDLLELERAGVRASICGRALYTGAIDLHEAYRVLRGASPGAG